MSEKHHNFSPSALSRRALCPASIKEVEIPEQPNEHSEEGRMLHECVKLGRTDGLTFDQKEMVIRCLKLRGELISGASHVEDEVHLELRDEAGKLITEGTADLVAVFDEKSGLIDAPKIVVADWKFGRILQERAEENWQGAGYCVMAMKRFKIRVAEFVIYYPRLFHKDTFTFTEPEAIEENIVNVIKACSVENPPYQPSEDACRYCKFKIYCPELKKETTVIERVENYPAISDVLLNEYYEKGKIVSKVIDGIGEELKNRCRTNGSCGKYKLSMQGSGYDITDIRESFDILSDKFGMVKSQFFSCLSASDAKLRDLCCELSDKPKREAVTDYELALTSCRIAKPQREVLTIIK